MVGYYGLLNIYTVDQCRQNSYLGNTSLGTVDKINHQLHENHYSFAPSLLLQGSDFIDSKLSASSSNGYLLINATPEKGLGQDYTDYGPVSRTNDSPPKINLN